MERFKDKNYYLSDFLDVIFVSCPLCQKKARLINDKNKSSLELYCPACGYYKKRDRSYYSLKFTRNCPECGKQISLSRKRVSNPKESMKISCQHCGFTENYAIKYAEYTIYEWIEKGKERFFNTDLWLKKEYKGNIFWASNYKHLEYLKEYIQSKIRIEGCKDGDYYWNTTMAARLPKFIKSSKNRENLLKIIKQLEDK